MMTRLVDHAVVGGGLAGLYLTYRLLQRGMRVEIFEADSDIGGRAQSRCWSEVSTEPINIGAMRYLENHVRMEGLVRELGLRTRLQRETTPQHDRFYLRGRRLTRRDFVDPSGNLGYELASDERASDPDMLFEKFAVRALGALGLRPPLEYTFPNWLSFLQENEGILRSIGFWECLMPVMSSEAYLLLRDANGYDVENWDLYEVLKAQLVDFGNQAPAAIEIVGGTGALANRLAEEIRGQGGVIHVRNMVKTVYLPGPGDAVALTTSSGDSLAARALTLAVPPLAISHLAGIERVRDALEMVLRGAVSLPTVRVFFGFDRPWWVDSGLPLGGARCMTDLPVRLITFPPSFTSQSGQISYILCLHVNDPRAYDVFSMSSLREVRAFWNHESLKEALPILTEMLRQVEQVVGGEAPDPTWVLLHDWGKEPHGAAYHGRRSSGVPLVAGRDLVAQPLPDIQLSVVNAAFSTSPTWMEGALESAEAALSKAWNQVGSG